MFARKQKAEPPRRTKRDAGGDDAGLDLSGALLREIAGALINEDPDEKIEHAEVLERRALHLLIRTPAPDAPTDGAAQGDPGARDFGGARRAARARLQSQRQTIDHTLHGLRDVIDAFTEGFSNQLRDDVRSDRRAFDALTTLRDATHAGSADALRNAALHAVSEVTTALEEKRTIRQDVLTAVSEKMRPIREQIERQRRAPTLAPETQVLDADGLSLVAKVAEQSKSLFVEDSCVFVVQAAEDAAPVDFANALHKCFPRRRDSVGRLSRLVFAVVARDGTQAELERFAERIRERVPQVAGIGGAVTRDDDGPSALDRARAAGRKAASVGGGAIELVRAVSSNHNE